MGAARMLKIVDHCGIAGGLGKLVHDRPRAGVVAVRFQRLRMLACRRGMLPRLPIDRAQAARQRAQKRRSYVRFRRRS